jgi:DNA-binding FrmR family transcriptional regulator
LKEIEQNEFTYRFESCRSKLDRIYTNIEQYEWLDRDISCVALNWDDGLSRHRPIAGHRRSRAGSMQNESVLQTDMVGGPEWRHRVQTAYLEKLREVEGIATGIQSLLYVKAAVKQVTQQMAREKASKPLVLGAADRLAWTMRYARAVERRDWRRSSEARQAFPEINGKTNGVKDQDLQEKGIDKRIHEWILKLAEANIQEELEEVKRMQAEGDELGGERKREHIIRRLKRLYGGANGSIKAMKDEQGMIRTDPKGMIDILQQHWAEVFRGRGVNEDLLEQWLKQMYPQEETPSLERDLEGRRGWRTGLPQAESNRWEISKQMMWNLR